MQNSGQTSPLKPPLTTPFSSSILISLQKIRLDKVDFRGSIQTFGIHPYSTFVLPKPLALIFECKNIKISGAGFVSPPGSGGSFSTNGAILTRQHLNLEIPGRGITHNQLTDEEHLGKAGCLEAREQIELFLKAQNYLYSLPDIFFPLSYGFRLPIYFSFIEFYIELFVPPCRDEFFRGCSRAVSKIFGAEIKGARDVFREIKERASLRKNFEYVWEIEDEVLRYRGEKIRIKLYEKGFRVRLEVSFRNFRTRLQTQEGGVIQREMIVTSTRSLLEDLHFSAIKIINMLAPALTERAPKNIDTELLRNKFKEYGARGLKGPAYCHMISSFDERGIYDPLTVPRDERPSGLMLDRFSSPHDGILIKRSSLDKNGRPKRNFYILKEDWQKIQRRI